MRARPCGDECDAIDPHVARRDVPPAEVSKTLYVIKALPLNISRLQNKLWSELKLGN